MKAIVLTSILAVLLSVSGLHASEPKNRILNNQETTEFGVMKECISLDEITSKPLDRTVYLYNTTGQLQERICYVWNSKTGWTGSQRYEYEYNQNGQIANLIYTAWNKGLASWSPKSQHIIHIYNIDGSFLATKRIEVNNIEDSLVAVK